MAPKPSSKVDNKPKKATSAAPVATRIDVPTTDGETTGDEYSELHYDPSVADPSMHDEDDNPTEPAPSLKKSKSKTKAASRASLASKRPVKKAGGGCKCCKFCSTFPCCCELPLEIGVQLLCLIDIIHSAICLILWASLLGMDLFANKLSNSTGTDSFYPPTVRELDPFGYTTTTKLPPWTIRKHPKNAPLFDYNLVDIETASRSYSKIAELTTDRHEIIERACGTKYLENFLLTYELDKTNSLWQQFLFYASVAEGIYIIISTSLIMCICCFIEHRGSKLLVILFWWLYWIAIFMEYQSIILSQSKRLCILEYGFDGFRGQLFLLIFLAFRTVFLKPYQLLVHFFYIKELLIYGYLKDECVHPTKESDYAREYFSEFYAMEAQREGGNAEAYMSTNTSHALAFDALRHSDVARIQHNVMTAQDDGLTRRNREIREMQSGKVQTNIKSVRHS